MIKVKSFKKLKGNSKKYEITFEKNGKIYTRKFGAAGMSDFTIHKDKERRERYISRHKKDLKTGDPMRAGYLSMYILWNKPSLKSSLADYKRRLNTYNRTGKFPMGISGSKKLKFGSIIPFKNTGNNYLDNLPWDIQNIIQQNVSASDIQRIQRGKTRRIRTSNYIKSPLYLKDLLIKKKRTRNAPWSVLNPDDPFTFKWFNLAANILTQEDLDTDIFWYRCIFNVIILIESNDPEDNYFGPNEWDYYNELTGSLEILLAKMGHNVDFEPSEWGEHWYTRARMWLEEEYDPPPILANYFGKSKIPDNVVNKKLYSSVKSKIKRSIKGRRWGAYDSGRLVREYKAKGGKYTGSKGKTNLSRWYKEKWVDACAWPKRKSCGNKSNRKVTYCRPSKKVDSKTPKLVQKLTKAQLKNRCSKKKRDPMKRVTKFGVSMDDESLAYGDGMWVIHCSYFPWGAHSTVRYKPLSKKPADYSYHYGIHNSGALRWWASGGAQNTRIPDRLLKILINHYNNRCLDIKKTGQSTLNFYINDQYGTLLNFGSKLDHKLRIKFYKDLFDKGDISSNIEKNIAFRCKKGFNDSFCQRIFTELILSIYFTVLKRSSNTKEIIDNLIEMKKVYNLSNYKPTILIIKASDVPKINEFLYLMQDNSYGSFKNARIASLTYELIYFSNLFKKDVH